LNRLGTSCSRSGGESGKYLKKKRTSWPLLVRKKKKKKKKKGGKGRTKAKNSPPLHRNTQERRWRPCLDVCVPRGRSRKIGKKKGGSWKESVSGKGGKKSDIVSAAGGKDGATVQPQDTGSRKIGIGTTARGERKRTEKSGHQSPRNSLKKGGRGEASKMAAAG